MPLTPTHLGPGLFAYSLKPRLFNFWALALGSMVMDGENVFWTIMNLFRSCTPACGHHGFFHSILSAVLGSFILSFFLKLVSDRFKKDWSMPKLFYSSFLGWLSHIFLDSLVHADVFLFWPIRINPFLISWSLYRPLSLGLSVLGLISLLIITLRKLLKKHERTLDNSL